MTKAERDAELAHLTNELNFWEAQVSELNPGDELWRDTRHACDTVQEKIDALITAPCDDD